MVFQDNRVCALALVNIFNLLFSVYIFMMTRMWIYICVQRFIPFS